jgi:ribosomal protein S18 acetylase RimI-like enzyme
LPPTLRPISDEELAQFLDEVIARYTDERVMAGERPEEARRTATEQTATSFPGGKPTPGHLIYRVLDDAGAAVGLLWIGPHRADHPEAFWVWDIEIEESHRGKGLGRAVMLLAETEARAHEAIELGLNVFGHNVPARHLYESMGYTTTAVNMRKLL